jgi:protein-tyrosine-phosphatase
MTTFEILIVCSGNTCRSPLAAAMLARRAAREPGLEGTVVSSAGTSAWNGAPVSEGSFLVGLERGIDLSRHRARRLTADAVRGADLILTMGESHLHRVAELGGAAKAHTFRGFADDSSRAADVPDPFGGDVAAYRETAETFDALIEKVIARLLVIRQKDATA